jgi:CubicO group peptidase (beta-lactamase class C family)
MNINKIDELTEQVRMALGAPGVAVVVVKNGKTYAQGYGVKNREENTLVTPDTSFALASVSKAFTAMALAILVEEKKLNWDDLVRVHLPAFRLQDMAADTSVTVRDLVCHRTGLPRHDKLWYRTPLSRQELLARMGSLKPTAPLRAKYQYNNLCFMVAGEVVRAVSGAESFESFLQERLLKPLGMKNISFSGPGLLATDDHATPHQNTDKTGKTQRWETVPALDFSSVAPCGGMNASAREMGKWLEFQLAKTPKIITSETRQETRIAHMMVPLDENFRRLYPETVLQAYGLGWTILDYRGNELITHSGAIDGFLSACSFCPRSGVGVCVLTNGGSYLSHALRNMLLDYLLELPEKDWVAVFQDQKLRDSKQEKVNKTKRKTETVKNTKPHFPLKSYAGEYHDAGYGTVTITHSKNKLIAQWESFEGSLTHRHYETFTTKSAEESFTDEDITFTSNASGKIATLTLWGVTFQKRD